MPGSSDTETMVSTAQRQLAGTNVDHELILYSHPFTDLINMITEQSVNGSREGFWKLRELYFHCLFAII